MEHTTTNTLFTLNIKRIVITGILAAIAILLGITRLGFIPVPNISGNATIMHVPAIIGGVLEGPLVGLLVGGIFGIFSWLQADNPLFADPTVAVLPRLFIGVTSAYAYLLLKNHSEYAALVASSIVGTLTNTCLVVGMAVLRGYIPLAVIPTIIPQAIAEIVIAIIITVAVVSAWRGLERGRGKSSL